MDDAGDPIAHLHPDLDDQALPPYRHDLVLKCLLSGRGRNYPAQLVGHPLVGVPDLPAKWPEERGGTVEHLATAPDRGLNAPSQVPEVVYVLGHRRDQRGAVPRP